MIVIVTRFIPFLPLSVVSTMVTICGKAVSGLERILCIVNHAQNNKILDLTKLRALNMQMTNTYDVEAVLHDVENIVGKGDDALSLFPMIFFSQGYIRGRTVW